jgi:hypothetical protein
MFQVLFFMELGDFFILPWDFEILREPIPLQSIAYSHTLDRLCAADKCALTLHPIGLRSSICI